MPAKLEDHHRQRPAYIYVRQSTIAQVRHHQESTERQYALKDKAIALGWSAENIRILDRDLGVSGAQASNRQDFKMLAADVSMGKVGAVLALEASRLARSCLDWQRLLELCAFTQTLVIDEDGLYDPADFNDGLLLGIKGTIAQAELHMIRARLQGGKLNKARKGELRFPLPVGLSYDLEGRVVLDLDEEVRESVRQIFRLFRQCGSAYGVAQHFAVHGLRFPKRAYGGLWAGKLIWDRLKYTRVLSVLKNPAYAGVYAYGKSRTTKQISAEGAIQCRILRVPRDSWEVLINEHHEGYIGWEEFLTNQATLERNRTFDKESVLSGPAREGLALLQGLSICARCGRRLTVTYAGNRGIYPTYNCHEAKREGIAPDHVVTVRCEILDAPVAERVLEVLAPAQLDLAVQATRELERRDDVVMRQWRMRLERADYEAQLAQKRYEEVDPSNRLVAATVERRWNDRLLELERVRKQFAEFEKKHARVATPDQKAEVLALARDFPRLWNAPTTKTKDRKRMLRLLIKDITVERDAESRRVQLHIRWQGGACEELTVDLPPRHFLQPESYTEEMIERVRSLAQTRSDREVAKALNSEGLLSVTGRPFTRGMIRWIRTAHGVSTMDARRPHEFTVNEVAEKFGVHRDTVRRWMGKGLVNARRRTSVSRRWVLITPEKENELRALVRSWTGRSSRDRSPQAREQEGGAV